MSDKGMTVWEALEALYEQDLGFLTHVDRYDYSLQRPLIEDLAAGKKYAMGFPEGGRKEKVIARELWGRRFDYFDVDDDSVSAPGIRFVDIRIFDGEKPKPSHEQQPQVSEADLTNWLKKQWAAGPLGRDDGEKAARAHFKPKAVYRTTYRKLYQATRPAGLGKIGRPPSAN